MPANLEDFWGRCGRTFGGEGLLAGTDVTMQNSDMRYHLRQLAPGSAVLGRGVLRGFGSISHFATCLNCL